jgi:hypothetical protein
MRPDVGDLFTHLNKDDGMATLRFVISDSGYFLQIRWLDAILYKEGCTAGIHVAPYKMSIAFDRFAALYGYTKLAPMPESDQL